MEVGGSVAGGSDVDGSEPPLPPDESPDSPPLVANVAAGIGEEVAVKVGLLIRVGVGVDRKVGISPGVSIGLLPSAVPVALSPVAKIAAVAGTPAGNVSSGVTIASVAVATGVDSFRNELLITKINPAAMTTRSNNPAAPISNQVAIPIPDLVVGAAVL